MPQSWSTKKIPHARSIIDGKVRVSSKETFKREAMHLVGVSARQLANILYNKKELTANKLRAIEIILDRALGKPEAAVAITAAVGVAPLDLAPAVLKLMDAARAAAEGEITHTDSVLVSQSGENALIIDAGRDYGNLLPQQKSPPGDLPHHGHMDAYAEDGNPAGYDDVPTNAGDPDASVNSEMAEIRRSPNPLRGVAAHNAKFAELRAQIAAQPPLPDRKKGWEAREASLASRLAKREAKRLAQNAYGAEWRAKRKAELAAALTGGQDAHAATGENEQETPRETPAGDPVDRVVS